MRYAIIGGGALSLAINEKLILRKSDQCTVLVDKIGCDRADRLGYKKLSNFFKESRCENVFLCGFNVASRDDCIQKPYSVMHDNLSILITCFEALRKSKIKNFRFISSNAVFPQSAAPLSEDSLFSGRMSNVYEPYGLPKAVGLVLTANIYKEMKSDIDLDYRTFNLTNLYGSAKKRNYNNMGSSLIEDYFIALINAKQKSKQTVILQGNEHDERDFLHYSDAAEACIFVSNVNSEEFSSVCDAVDMSINIASGNPINLAFLANKIARLVNYKGLVSFTNHRPPVKRILDIGRINQFGWKPKVTLDEGLYETFKYITHSL